MRKALASIRALVLAAGLPVLLFALVSTGGAQVAGTAPPPATNTPRPGAANGAGAVRASDWLSGSPAAADSAEADSAGDSTEADSAGADSATTGSVHADSIAAVPGPIGGEAPDSRGSGPRSPDLRSRLLPNVATGVSIGYPSYPGVFITAPADGPLAFRTGFTGFPTIGLLWTPGLEYRFGEQAGTLSQSSIYSFANAFLGRSYLDGDEHSYTGMEAGFGYRWLIDDRRDVRWIAAVEAGGYWRGDPVKPRRICLRFIWTLVE